METISMTIAEMILRSMPIFLSIIIPGYLISLALFKKTRKFSYLEMFFLGIPFGMFVPSFLSLIEFTIGIQYSPLITLINLAIITLVPFAYLYKENISILPEKEETETTGSAEKKEKRYVYPALLLIILFLSFWIRIQSLTPYYYDFDPYWYNMAAQFIIQHGSIPPTDDYAWYPNPDSHRTFPFIPYMEAGWYNLFTIFNNHPQFNFELFTMTTGLYPPIIAMLTVFFAYLWLSREYNQKLALAIAAILAFTPVFLQKTGAGSFEFTPFGMFGIVAFASMLALTLKYKSKEIAIATGFLLGITAFGSNSSLITPLIFAGTLGYIGLMGYLRNKTEEMKETLKLGIIIAGITVFTFLLLLAYYLPLNYLPWIPVGISLLPIILLFAFNELLKFTKNEADKLLYLSSLIIIGLVLLILTPLNAMINSVLGMIGYVATNPDVTMKTIAEQTAAPSDFSGSLGVLGINVAISLTPFIIIISLVTLLIKLGEKILNKPEIFEESLIIIAILATAPFALAGLIKAKYVVFMGLATPILFGFFAGEILKIKTKYVKDALFIIIALLAIYQVLMFSDTIIRSLSLSFVDVVDNTKYYENVCNVIARDINSVSNSKDMINQFLTDTRINSYRVYCSRIPDSWLDAILWIRDNVQGTDDRVMSWWDYGHWINTIGQSKSVTGNTHSYTIMHQEVADKIVGNSTQKLIQYMKEHKAKYLLLDQDLIGKWGALVYHYCNYNNETTVNKQPGESLCDLLAAPEYIYIPTSQASASYCNMKTETGQRAIKVFSTHGEALGFNYYCMADGSLPFYYENKTKAGIENIVSLGTTDDGRFIRAIAIYSSTNPDRKGRFYDSIFYKGFFEGNIPGMTQVYPNRYSNKPDEYVRIFKID
ncbi:MAG: STT3 domain-containing protein [Candidatus Micrarchaeia archaeon]